MTSKIMFEVIGDAKPAGSKRAIPIYRKGPNGSKQLVTRPNGSPMIAVTDANPQAKEWQAEVRKAAREAYRLDLLRGPARLTLRFVRVRPKGHSGTGRNAGVVKESAPPWPITKPDVLKLARGVEDALTGVIWVDDSQVVDECLTKTWGEPARCEVIIEPLDPAEQRRVRQLVDQAEEKPF